MDYDKPDDVEIAKRLDDIRSDGTLSEPLRRAGRRETAEYITSLLVEVRKLALAQNMRLLVYFIEMAFQEAYKQAEADEREAA